MPHKQPKMSRYQPSKPSLMTNFFEKLKEELDDTNTNIRLEKTAKALPIFITRINNI